MKTLVKEKFLKIGLIICAILFAIPSVKYIINNGTVLNLKDDYCFLLDDSDRLVQAGIYLLLLCIFAIFYYFIIKKRKQLFNNIKEVLLFIAIISVCFAFIVPFESSDVFYYLGVGRLQSQYNQNPYYENIKDYVDNNNVDMTNDTVLQKGYSNYWSQTTVVYGALWTLICNAIAGMSLGNVNLGLLLFKILNLAVHLINCYIIYKISNRKIFALIYGLNPFVLLESIANVHNDICVVLFILLSMYFLKNKKNLILSVLFLACATAIKYFAILLLPIIVIYYYRNENIKTRIINCIKYGILFGVFLAIPYLLYIQDIQVFKGMADQQSKITKGFYLFIEEYFPQPEDLAYKLSDFALMSFIIIYLARCIVLLCNPQISLKKELQSIYWFLLTFIFLLITGFQPWYLMWLCPIMMWQKSRDIKLIVQMQILTQIANSIFIMYTESYKYGVPFFFIFVVGTLICIIKNKKERIVYIEKKEV